MEEWENKKIERSFRFPLTQHCSRSLRSAQSRTESGICDKWIPSFQHSSIPMFPKRLDISPEFRILTPGSLPYALRSMPYAFIATDHGRLKKNTFSPGIPTAFHHFLDFFLADPSFQIRFQLDEFQIHLVEHHVLTLNFVFDRIDGALKHKVRSHFFVH